MMNNTNTDFLQYVKLTADENRIPRDTVTDALKDAIIKAYDKEFPESKIEIKIDLDQSLLSVSTVLQVVEPYEDLNDYTEISLGDALKYDANTKVGETIHIPVDLAKLDRPIISHILQVFKHNIFTDANRQVHKNWSPRIGDVVFAEVEKVDHRSGHVTVSLDGTYGFLSNKDRIPEEILVPGQRYNFYIRDVKEQTRGWPIILSRSDPGLIKYLLKIQIPEIQENIIEIKNIARIAGFKTKLSVISHQPGVEAVGTIIGPRGARIKAVQDQIHGEHIEVIEYSDDFKKYIVDVCSPAEVSGVSVIEPATPLDRRQIVIVTRPDKAALLIGKKGANIRLISQLLNADIEIQNLEEAHTANLQYQRIEVQNSRQQAFNRTYNKYKSGTDILKQYKTVKIDNKDMSLDKQKDTNTEKQ